MPDSVDGILGYICYPALKYYHWHSWLESAPLTLLKVCYVDTISGDINSFQIHFPGTVTPSNATIPTVTDNLFSQGLIDANEIGISFEPTNKTSNRNGELTWGQ